MDSEQSQFTEISNDTAFETAHMNTGMPTDSAIGVNESSGNSVTIENREALNREDLDNEEDFTNGESLANGENLANRAPITNGAAMNQNIIGNETEDAGHEDITFNNASNLESITPYRMDELPESENQYQSPSTTFNMSQPNDDYGKENLSSLILSSLPVQSRDQVGKNHHAMENNGLNSEKDNFENSSKHASSSSSSTSSSSENVDQVHVSTGESLTISENTNQVADGSNLIANFEFNGNSFIDSAVSADAVPNSNTNTVMENLLESDNAYHGSSVAESSNIPTIDSNDYGAFAQSFHTFQVNSEIDMENNINNEAPFDLSASVNGNDSQIISAKEEIVQEAIVHDTTEEETNITHTNLEVSQKSNSEESLEEPVKENIHQNPESVSTSSNDGIAMQENTDTRDFINTEMADNSIPIHTTVSDEVKEIQQNSSSSQSSNNELKTEEKVIEFYQTHAYNASFTLLNSLMSHNKAWPFNSPVDPTHDVDYVNVIYKPMDFGTIKTKFEYHNYKNIEEIQSDILLVFSNCKTYYSPDSEFASMCDEVHRLFLKCWPLVIRAQNDNLDVVDNIEAIAASCQEEDAVAVSHSHNSSGTSSSRSSLTSKSTSKYSDKHNREQISDLSEIMKTNQDCYSRVEEMDDEFIVDDENPEENEDEEREAIELPFINTKKYKRLTPQEKIKALQKKRTILERKKNTIISKTQQTLEQLEMVERAIELHENEEKKRLLQFQENSTFSAVDEQLADDSYLCLVTYNGTKLKHTCTNVNSVNDLKRELLACFKLSAKHTIEYFDDDFQEYALLYTLNGIPQKLKIKIKSKRPKTSQKGQEVTLEKVGTKFQETFKQKKSEPSEKPLKKVKITGRSASKKPTIQDFEGSPYYSTITEKKSTSQIEIVKSKSPSKKRVSSPKKRRLDSPSKKKRSRSPKKEK